MYHIALNLKHKKITIIGGGKVAYRKAKSLCEEDCKLIIIAPYFIKAFHSLDAYVHRIYKRYEKGDCIGSLLVFAATQDAKLNQEIQKDCEAQHILCNVVSDQTISDFITPAQVTKGDLTLSVSTNGKSPALAAVIKNELASLYGEGDIQKVKLLGQIRAILLTEVVDEKEKQSRLKQLATLSNEELVRYLNQLTKT